MFGNVIDVIKRFSPGSLNASDVLQGAITFLPDQALDHPLVRGRRVKRWSQALGEWLTVKAGDGSVSLRDVIEGLRTAHAVASGPARAKRKRAPRRS